MALEGHEGLLQGARELRVPPGVVGEGRRDLRHTVRWYVEQTKQVRARGEMQKVEYPRPKADDKMQKTQKHTWKPNYYSL